MTSALGTVLGLGVGLMVLDYFFCPHCHRNHRHGSAMFESHRKYAKPRAKAKKVAKPSKTQVAHKTKKKTTKRK